MRPSIEGVLKQRSPVGRDVKKGRSQSGRYTEFGINPKRKNPREGIALPGVLNGQPEAFIKEVSSRIPMNRLAKADEYQGTLIWMLSDASSYLNGAVLPVDAGRTAW